MSPATQAAPPAEARPFKLDQSGWPIVPPTQVTIHRTSRRDERSRQIVCRLDGDLVAVLLFGQARTIEVAPGRHVLRVHNTLHWRTAEFDVPPGEHVHFTVLNRNTRWYYPLLLVIGVAPLYLEVRRGVPDAVEA
jgi:hypothetical protein